MASAKSIRALKGFNDILPTETPKWRAIEAIAHEVAEVYGYREIRTPVLESSDVFHRGVGETSDIVRKETYTFADRDGDSVTLRPEGTAGVTRAVIEAGYLNDQGARAKVYYLTSNFRHERPQKGRVRQHHQFGVEAFGVASPEQDVECILLQLAFYARCGVKDLELRINSLGDRESKERYRDTLVEFLKPHEAGLSEDSQRRLSENPLRILDSKDPRDQEICASAPSPINSLSDRSKLHFDRVVALLTLAGASFRMDAALVRGFDYYTDTLWEVTAGGLGAQSAIGGGGRYDNLVEQLGGKPTPGVGFGSGIERLLIALEAQNVTIPDPRKPLVWLAHHGDKARDHNLRLAQTLRQAGIATDMDLSGRAIKAQFKMADRENARFVVVVGDDELAKQCVQLKDLQSGTQTSVDEAKLIETLRAG
ncbi:MAG: histidine--tRNA ligase [Tepidisphaeraceae bacterium]